MGCNNQPIVKDWRTPTSELLAFGSVDTNAPSQWYPLDAEILEFGSLAESASQAVLLKQVLLRETASSAANIKKNDITLYFYRGSAPTAPTEGAVYNPSTSNLIAVAQIVTADYYRVSDTVWEAVVNPERLYSTGTSATATEVYCVALFSGSSPSQYVAGVGIAVQPWTEVGDVMVS